MRTSFSLMSVAVIVVLISGLGFLLNAEVVYGGFLSLLGGAVGVCLAGAIYFVKKHKNQQSMYILTEPSAKTPWYKKVFQTELILAGSIFVGMLATSVLNNQLLYHSSYQQVFTVTGQGQRIFRASQYNYLELCNGSQSLKFLGQAGADTGDQVIVTLRRGLLGFPVLVAVEEVSFTSP